MAHPLPLWPEQVRRSTLAAVQVSPKDDATVVSLSGEHDLATLKVVEAAFASAVARGVEVIVDLTPCEFIDCSVARALSRLDAATTRILVGSATPMCVSRLLDLLAMPFTEAALQPRLTALGVDEAA